MNPDDLDYPDFYFDEEEQDIWNDEQELFDPLEDLEDGYYPDYPEIAHDPER